MRSRILNLVGDFYEMQWGLLTQKRFNASEAQDFLRKQQNKYYDASIVDTFCEQLGQMKGDGQVANASNPTACAKA